MFFLKCPVPPAMTLRHGFLFLQNVCFQLLMSKNKILANSIVRWLCFSYINLNMTLIFYCSEDFHYCLLYFKDERDITSILSLQFCSCPTTKPYIEETHKKLFIKKQQSFGYFWLNKTMLLTSILKLLTSKITFLNCVKNVRKRLHVKNLGWNV